MMSRASFQLCEENNMPLEYMIKDDEYPKLWLIKSGTRSDKKWDACPANLNQHFHNQGVSISLEPCHKLDECPT